MGPLIGIVAVALVAFLALAVWRGRLVSVALAGAECPDCRVPFVSLRIAGGAHPVRAGGPHGHGARSPRIAPAGADEGSDRSDEGDPPAMPWEVCVCPRCDRVVTTVGGIPSPVADCPSCRQRSLVVYAERVDGSVVIDEWCDLCGRRGRSSVEDPPAARGGRDGDKAPDEAPPRSGRVLPFRRD